MANECSKEDKEYADFWRNYYTPEGAYAFGLKVQSLVSNEDLSGIFSLVQGELQNGPRKAFVANKTFKEVFDEEWISQVLGDNAPCSPMGWRGFMLGNGLIWYNKAEDEWAIFSINGFTFSSPKVLMEISDAESIFRRLNQCSKQRAGMMCFSIKMHFVLSSPSPEDLWYKFDKREGTSM